MSRCVWPSRPESPPARSPRRSRHGCVSRRASSRVDVAGPGFLNVTLGAGSLGSLAREIVTAGGEYGRTKDLAGQRINLEFVSANPTGPVHLGHTRWAALGDSLHRLLEAAGADVAAEHYINDFGSQMTKFGAVADAQRARPTRRPTTATTATTSTTSPSSSSPPIPACST